MGGRKFEKFTFARVSSNSSNVVTSDLGQFLLSRAGGEVLKRAAQVDSGTQEKEQVVRSDGPGKAEKKVE